MGDLAAIQPVLQYQVERAATDRFAAPASARGADPALAGNAAGGEVLLQQPDRAELGIATKYVSHALRLGLDDDQFAVLDGVAERRHTAHPHPFLLRGGDFVADPLAGYLALELGKGQQHVERQPAHRRRGSSVETGTGNSAIVSRSNQCRT